MTKDEALKLALEYLEDSDNYLGSIDNSKPIAAIKQALAQPEERYTYGTPLLDAFTKPAPVQEPDHSDELTIAYMSGVHRGKELAAQRQWVGLTDDEFENIELGCRSTSSGKIEAMQKVEAKLKEKNNG